MNIMIDLNKLESSINKTAVFFFFFERIIQLLKIILF